MRTGEKVIIGGVVIAIIILLAKKKSNPNPGNLPNEVLQNLQSAVPGSQFLMRASDGVTYSGTVTNDHYLAPLYAEMKG